MPLVEVASDALLLKGSPSTLFYTSGDVVYIVDPGHGKKRVKQIRKEVRQLGAPSAIAIVTHYHSDHHSAIAQGLREHLDKVMAPSTDAPAIRDPGLRIALTFGIPLPSGDPLLPFTAPKVEVDQEVDPGDVVGGLEVVALPGHTPGQVGLLTPGGALYAADSLFGPRVLDTYAVPYHFNPCQALDTLERMMDIIGSKVDVVIPSHGPPARGDDAVKLIESNAARITEAWRVLEEELSEPMTVGEAAVVLASRFNASPSPGLLMLVETAVRGFISCRRSELEAVVTPRGVAWRVSRA